MRVTRRVAFHSGVAWSDAHAESAAANIVGPDFAIPTPDPGAYAERLEHWLQNPSARRQAGQAMRQRAEKHYSFHAYAEKLFATLDDYHDRDACALGERCTTGAALE